MTTDLQSIELIKCHPQFMI